VAPATTPLRGARDQYSSSSEEGEARSCHTLFIDGGRVVSSRWMVRPSRNAPADDHQQHRTKAPSPSDYRTGQRVQKLIRGVSRGYRRKVKLVPNLEAGQDQEVPDTRQVDHRGSEIDNSDSIQAQYDTILQPTTHSTRKLPTRF
jgi:hypothetical protein